jgi:hypothetical protein
MAYSQNGWQKEKSPFLKLYKEEIFKRGTITANMGELMNGIVALAHNVL